MPDCAELFAILRLKYLAECIRSRYSPGMQVEVIHDGSLIAPAFGVERAEVASYERYFRKLLSIAKADATIHTHDFCQLQCKHGLRQEVILGRLLEEARHWWSRERGGVMWRECFRKTAGMLNLRHLSLEQATDILSSSRMGSLPPRFADVERSVHESMIFYHALDTLIHQLDPRPLAFPDSIHATTRVQPGRLALWLIRRGRAMLPWHGVGVIDGCGRSAVVSYSHAQIQELTAWSCFDESTPFVSLRNWSGASCGRDTPELMRDIIFTLRDPVGSLRGGESDFCK